MATAKTLTRIQDLAKELDVHYKEILDWCKQEDITAEGGKPLVNVSGVKAGLAESIREEFRRRHASGETAAKQAAPVPAPVAPASSTVVAEVKKPAVAARARARKAVHEPEPATVAPAIEAPATPAATPTPAVEPEPVPLRAAETLASQIPTAATPPKSPPTPAAPAKPVPFQTHMTGPVIIKSASSTASTTPVPRAIQPLAPRVKNLASVAQTPPAPAAPPVAPPSVASPASPAAPRVRPSAVGVMNVPNRPDVVKPAGEQMNTPTKRALRGPQVIRIEAPENLPTPRPRTARPGDGNAPATRGPGGERVLRSATMARSAGPARGGGVRGGKPGESTGEDKNKRRSLSGRRGGNDAPVLTGPAKLSKADLDELDARVKGASGFIKQRRKDMHRRDEHGAHYQAPSAAEVGGVVVIEEPITIKAFSAATGIKAADCIKYLFKQGKMVTVNSVIPSETAMEIALENDIELEVKAHQTAAQKVEKEFANRERKDVRQRPPVVTILGHVDHGKTSLLDRIRQSDVAAHEDGGITQHVGAYRISIDGTDGQKKTVVFLDTPGHAAFTSMRARGAKITDVVVLLVSADDGMMPQTIESVAHAKAANVPVVVAFNKIDLIPPKNREDAMQRLYGQMAEHGLNAVAWGGQTEVVPVSARTGEGIPQLIEILDLQAGVLDLKADFDGPAQGTVIEAEMQSGRGSVARVMVQEGFLHVGDFFVAGRAFGRIRGLTDDRDRRITDAGPSTPVEVNGIDSVPDAGDRFYCVDSLQRAEEIAKQYRDDERQTALARETRVTLDNFASALQAGKVQHLNVVLKADVQGSVETLRKTLEDLGNEEVKIRVLHAGVGSITENDVLLADASNAVVVGFHVTATPAVKDIADSRHVEIRTYRIIYELLDELKKSLAGLLAPVISEEETGRAEVKEVFRIGKVGNIAGSLVVSGAANKKDVKVRLIRDGTVITENRNVDALRRHKDDVSEVRAGTECGIRLEGFEDIKPGDTMVFYRVVETKRTLL